jgi:Late exocytosis, associated with Golgi transport
MTTLESIGFTCALGVTAFTASSIAFGCAIRHRSVFVSPRCIARPPNVIYNPQAAGTGSAQDRGYCDAWFPSLGWIPWVLSIPYDTMLKGVPGTGTRDGGMSGCLLKLNLDAIVLLRFHVVGLKLSALATVLLLLIMLPIYKTSACFGETTDPSLYVMTTSSTNNNMTVSSSSSSSSTTTTVVYSNGYFYTTSSSTGETVVQAPSCNLTNYERLTMANIPSLAQVSSYGESFVHPQESGILSKLYACCFIFLILMVYLLYLLQQEWVQILAMRRVYYFERDIWRQRQQEQLELAAVMTGGNAPPSSLTTTNKRSKKLKKGDDKDRHLIDREPWVPHPEQPDTVPSIALYSVLVGGIPPPPPRRWRQNDQSSAAAAAASLAVQKSTSIADNGNDNHADNVVDNVGNNVAAAAVDKNDDDTHAVSYEPWSKRESIDWQLSLCGAFFDHCVPNQPGFSSSVAAVSILPGVRDISIGECVD